MFDSKRFFEESWPKISQGFESTADAEVEIAWILAHAARPSGARVLDAPCGFGRHSVLLARRGFDVTGVDLSATELERARQRAAAAGVTLRLVQQDMRDMDFSAEFDLALNLFSSIGYFSDDEDRLLLDRFCTGLRPGGSSSSIRATATTSSATTRRRRRSPSPTGGSASGTASISRRAASTASGGSRTVTGTWARRCCACTRLTSSTACSGPSAGRRWSCSATWRATPSGSIHTASSSWPRSRARRLDYNQPVTAEWTVAPEEVDAVRAYLAEHFPGGQVRVLTEPSDPGQLFQVVDKEGTRYTLKILREVLDDLRGRKVPLPRFLDKHEIARRLRHGGRLTVLWAQGEDMFREERA